MQELSPFVNKKLGFRSIFGHQRPSISLAHPACQELLGRDQAAYLGFKNLKKEAYLRAQNSQKLRPKKWLREASKKKKLHILRQCLKDGGRGSSQT